MFLGEELLTLCHCTVQANFTLSRDMKACSVSPFVAKADVLLIHAVIY